jgi:phage-related protein
MGVKETMPAKGRWAIEFYVTARGDCPVLDHIGRLPERDRAKLGRVLDLLAEYGLDLGLPHARPPGNGLWELRASAQRVFYVALQRRRFVLLHAYGKRSQKAPEREIETARRRWADLLEREG